MGLTKQGQPRQPPLPSAAHRAAQVPYPAAPNPDNWGSRSRGSCLIAPMSQQPEQVGVPTPSAHHPGARPPGRVSLRPPQQVLSIQTEFPEIFMPQPEPSPPSVGKKMVASPKVQMLKSLPPQLSAGKRFALKESPPKVVHSQVQLFESVRSKIRDTLAAALSVDPDQQMGHQSAGNESPLGSAGGNRHADGGRMQGNTTAFQDSDKDDDDDDENVTKLAARRSEHGEVLHSNLRPDMTIEAGDDMQQQTEHVPLGNKVWLCWDPDIVVGASQSMSQPNPKRVRMSDVHARVNVSEIGPESKRTITTCETTEEKKVRIHKAQSLAFKIEAELFKLFGGVNKKYKEKGRSLLFNLKNKNNSVLRDRVLSGDITPKCLCAMTIEELASKELSEWRMAKAEELSNMVVLPDRKVDFRRLVRKTHKGEFQIEVEETDLMEVALGGESLSYVPTRHIAVQTKSDDKTSIHNEVNESDNSVQDGVARSCNNNTPNNLEYPANEESDLMQEPIIDDLKVTENLPQIMTLDEFMQILHSEPHSEYQSTGALQNDPSIDKADKALKSENFPTAKDKSAASDFQFHSNFPSPEDNCESTLESPMNKSVSILDPVEEPKGDVLVKSPPEKVVAEKPDTVNGSIPESTMKCKITSDAALMPCGTLWEGSIQLSLSTLTNMVAIFKSGEKTSTNEWRPFLEIKGRVRLRDFEEFLEQLPKSRSRAIMVTELRWKEGSLESGRHCPSQTIDSYIGDERVGLVKLAEGVELYLCPRGKAAQVLADHLPKEHSGRLTVAGTSIIGLVVWRRSHVSHKVPNRQAVPKSQAMISSSVPPRISQPPSRSSDACRSQQDVPKSQATVSSSVVPKTFQPPSRSLNASCSHQDVATADVLPGFGPGVVKDDDDLPEYDFVSDSNSAGNVTPPQTHGSHQLTSLSEDRMRELIRKYGDTSVAAQPLNLDRDEFRSMVRKYGNLPEWNPNFQNNFQQEQIPQPQFHCQQQLQYHSMLQYDMAREPQGPLPHAYAGHEHYFDMPVHHPLNYGHQMQPAHPSYYGVPDRGGPSYFGAPDGSRFNDPWNQGLMAWNPW
uniref:Uncharacterized protein n=1 Tax=Avena sativa TaxID=4498 RepID=A0ACD5WXZ5_AVESA